MKLRQLENDSLTINHIEMERLLKEAQETLTISKKVAAESKRQIAEQLSKAVTVIQSKMGNCQHAIDALTQRSIEKMSAAEKSALTRIGQVRLNCEIQHSDQNVKEFFQRLTQHYEQVLTNVLISPFVQSIDRHMRVLYSKPAVNKISRHNAAKINVNCYNAMFYKYNTLNGRIYIQGEAGVGKSTFTAKLTLDWLCQKSSSQHLTSTFDDAQTLDAFDFVFYVTLRDSVDHRDVVQMINEQLINMIYTDEYRGAIYKLLQYIMQKYRCLVVLDGLDDWSDPKGQIAVPLMASSNILCTLLITTRPWKMTDQRIKDSHIDILLEIEGVENPDLLSQKLIGCLFNNETELKYNEFNSYIIKHQLFDLLNSPTMLTLIVCLWADGVCLKGSRCEIYSHILDCLLKRAMSRRALVKKPPFYCFRNTCFRNTIYCLANVAVIEALSSVAFDLFFAYRTEISKSFGNRELMKYLSEDQKTCALTTGILSERKHNSFTRINSTFSFVHKPLQEFLAAYYIANKPYVIDDEITNSIFKFSYLNLDISQTYIFLCGLNIKAAEKLSNVINTTCSTHSHLGRTTQNMILAGYKEAISNNNNNYIDFRPSWSFFLF
ncbi:uncharacterized protein LOC127832619 [Dreissena polymorpha]|uniref:NACHT domain-containing protein n=1 Tax=Dreissena polymorpha TaxID=45954 RepID=A0A9D4GPQ6_DREPO|nr:uncharacterized protein LOC127832619 [Dreissena polymorpha]KAH3819493.1 hypothetical protein DPMN_121230 [Dreissena polymorpha]